VDTTGEDVASLLADQLRSEGLAVERAFDGRSMKSQMKLADRSGARVALLVGPQELAAGEITIRDLRSDDFEQAQLSVAREDLSAAVRNFLNK
jgi:histidyl-tRNA synthetase